MNIQGHIETQEAYKEAVKRIDQHFHAAPGTPEGEEVELLIQLVRQYDEHHYPIPDPKAA